MSILVKARNERYKIMEWTLNMEAIDKTRDQQKHRWWAIGKIRIVMDGLAAGHVSGDWGFYFSGQGKTICDNYHGREHRFDSVSPSSSILVT